MIVTEFLLLDLWLYYILDILELITDYLDKVWPINQTSYSGPLWPIN